MRDPEQRLRRPFIRALVSSLLATSMVFGVVAGCDLGGRQRTVEIPDTLSELYVATPEDRDYDTYITAHEDMPYEGAPITTQLTEGDVGTNGVILRRGDQMTFTVSVPETAIYYPTLRYRSADDTILPNSYALTVNGTAPFSQMDRLIAPNIWVVEGERVLHDRYGNEVMAMPVKDHAWQEIGLHGIDYLYAQPMGLYLEAGENTFTIETVQGAIEVSEMTLAPRTTSLEVETAHQAPGNHIVVLEAEDMDRRNSPNIRPEATFNQSVTPYSTTRKVLNHVADISYRNGGDQIEYDFEVPEAGWYYIGLKYRQNERANFPAFRNIYIDGEIPSQDFLNAALPYAPNFERMTIGDAEGTSVPVYLEAGAHTIGIEVALDPVRDAIKLLTQMSLDMSDLALNIGKVTGGNTERFRDFRLEDFDFDIEGKLNLWAETLEKIHAYLATFSSQDGAVGALASLEVSAETMRTLAEEPNELPKHMDAFSTGASSARQNITTFLEQLYQSPLGLDQIYIYQEDAVFPETMNFVEKASGTTERFFHSFQAQEYSAQYRQNASNLQVWVNRPRQYLEIIQRLTDTDFTNQTGINVDLSLMPDQNRLILANASDTSPDIAMSTAAGLTYDLAIRGALADMRQFDTFKDVAGRVPAGLLIPGAADEGMYAMPETFNFWMLFYRKDILESMNLEVPETMQDVRDMLPQLQRRGMNFNSHVSNFVGIKPFAATVPFIYQAGGQLLTDDGRQTAIESEEALAGMRTLTENYTIYNMPYEVQNFYQSFRDGSIPIGISDYGMVNLLTNAAPEIKGMWGIAPYPGVMDDNGEIQRWTLGAAESIIIFDSSELKEEAWDYIDWWTSADIQVQFGNVLQSTMGNEYLWNPANLEAMEQTAWIAQHPEIIEQVKWIQEPPRVLGGYMIERELSNVVTNVVMEGGNLRSAMDEAIKLINRELTRKFEEFGYIENGRWVREYHVPNIETIEGWLAP